MRSVLDGVDDIKQRIGDHLGYGPYVVLTQERVDQFAAASGDHQWIHVDPVRARQGPFGGTVAHGLLLLSMVSELTADLFEFTGFRMGLNYGYDKIRFPTPALVGSRIRAGAAIVECLEIKDGWIETLLEIAVEQEGVGKPLCVASMRLRHKL